MLKRTALFCCFLAVLAWSCRPSKGVIKVQEVPNFDASAAHSMLFLTFELVRNGKDERATLTRSYAATGRVKDPGSHAHGPATLVYVVSYSNGKEPQKFVIDHPLYPVREVFSPNGSIEKVQESATNASLTLRLPIEEGMHKLELYSQKTAHKPSKIYTLAISL